MSNDNEISTKYQMKSDKQHILDNPKPGEDSYKHGRTRNEHTYHSQNKNRTVHVADGV
jgi:hypothetical protein